MSYRSNGGRGRASKFFIGLWLIQFSRYNFRRNDGKSSGYATPTHLWTSISGKAMACTKANKETTETFLSSSYRRVNTIQIEIVQRMDKKLNTFEDRSFVSREESFLTLAKMPIWIFVNDSLVIKSFHFVVDLGFHRRFPMLSLG